MELIAHRQEPFSFSPDTRSAWTSACSHNNAKTNFYKSRTGGGGGFTTGRTKAGCQEDVLLTDGRTRSSTSSSMIGGSEPSGGATRRELLLKTASSLPLFLSCFPITDKLPMAFLEPRKGCETCEIWGFTVVGFRVHHGNFNISSFPLVSFPTVSISSSVLNVLKCF